MVSVISPYSFRHMRCGKSTINAQSTVLKISLLVVWLDKQNGVNTEYLQITVLNSGWHMGLGTMTLHADAYGYSNKSINVHL